MLNVQLLSRRTLTQILILVMFLFNSTIAFAQSKVTGLVKDKAGEPLIGVNVVEKGTTNGTITNMDGEFTLDTAQGKTLQFSYIGYKTKEVTVTGSSLTVIMDDDNRTLDEVVVVGYGKMTRKDVTSSITTIKADDLNKGVYTNPAQMLQGKVPGLVITQSSDPNASPSITLRGASSFREGVAMEPFYVVDGVPGISLTTIAPDDIESIDVLRDASATAIYGSKASNGVIIVTTRKGTAGRTQVSYNGYVAVNNVAKNWDLMSGTQYKDFIIANNFALEAVDDQGCNTDWQKEVQRVGISNSHTVSLTGGSEKTNYNASLSYMRNDGVIKGTDMKRYIGRAFVETVTLFDRLKLSVNLNASITEQNYVLAGEDGLSVFDAMTYYLPTSPVRNADGSWFENTGKSQYYNPVSLIKENIDFVKSNRIQGIGRAQFTILPQFTYNLTLTYENEQYNGNYYNSTKSMSATGMNGKATRNTRQNDKKIMEMFFNYDTEINKLHKINAMAGYSWEESNDNDGFWATASNFFNDDLTYHNLGMANVIDSNSLGSYDLSTLRMISFFARANYSFASKYLVQATVRRDGSSAFGKNNRWATFPSASVAWRISEENFIKDLNAFDDLKIRVGYGESGNSLGFDVFTASAVYGATGWFTNSNNNLVRTLGAIRNANPDLKWERTSMLNVGLDFGFFNNRLSGTIEYYDKRTKDLIADYAVSTTKYLYGWLTTNVGSIRNKGVEVTINAIPVRTRNWSWTTSLNLSHNKNKVESISNEEFSVDYMDKAELNAPGQSGNCQQRIMEGSPIGQFYTWKWAGYSEDGVSMYYVYDAETGEATGETTVAPQYKDRTKTGVAQPKVVLGWNNTISYKKWSLNMFFNGVFGSKILNATRARLSNVTGNAGNRNLLASVLETEKVSDYNSHLLSDRYLENGNYVRLSTLTLSYDFGRIGNWASNIRIYGTCNNLFTITKYKGIDPEVYLGGLTPGIDNRQTYPRTRTFLIGANINF